MAYNEALADRILALLEDCPSLEQKKMFGGIAYMINGHMACGVSKDDLMLRLGPVGGPAALSEPHVLAMDFTGRPMASMVKITPEGYKTAAGLKKWIGKARAFAESEPTKVKKGK